VRRQTPSRFLKHLPKEWLDRRQNFSGGSQPRMLDAGEDVFEDPKTGKKMDIGKLMNRARENASRVRKETEAEEVVTAKAEAKAAAVRKKRTAAAAGDAYKAGDKVHHHKFGKGVVVSAEPEDDDWKVTVAFKGGGGVKKLLASVAKLERA